MGAGGVAVWGVPRAEPLRASSLRGRGRQRAPRAMGRALPADAPRAPPLGQQPRERGHRVRTRSAARRTAAHAPEPSPRVLRRGESNLSLRAPPSIHRFVSCVCDDRSRARLFSFRSSATTARGSLTSRPHRPTMSSRSTRLRSPTRRRAGASAAAAHLAARRQRGARYLRVGRIELSGSGGSSRTRRRLVCWSGQGGPSIKAAWAVGQRRRGRRRDGRLGWRTCKRSGDRREHAVSGGASQLWYASGLPQHTRSSPLRRVG